MGYMFYNAYAFNGDRGVSWPPSARQHPEPQKERKNTVLRLQIVECLLRGESSLPMLKAVEYL
eukprot:5569230-Amphidinium_carterae.1